MIIRRDTKTGANDLNTVYRPCKIDELVGHTTNKKILKKNLNAGSIPHTMLFTGPPGCGKTTAARIVALGLNCEKAEVMTASPCLECDSCVSILEDQNSFDVMELNVAQSGGKDAVDYVLRDLAMAAFGRYKIIIFDEAHKLTPSAQSLLLKTMEDGYKHVYFIFCTNHPEKLQIREDDAFIQRCVVMKFGRLRTNLIESLLTNVCQFEGVNYSPPILKYVADESEGTPRKALVWIQQIMQEESWTIEAAQEIVGSLTEDVHPALITLNRALVKGQWRESIKIYNELKSIPTESIRLSAAGYFSGCLARSTRVLEGKKFSEILDVITTPIREAGKPGRDKFLNYMFKIIYITESYSKGRH